MPGSVGSVIDAVPSRRTVTKGLAWTIPRGCRDRPGPRPRRQRRVQLHRQFQRGRQRPRAAGDLPGHRPPDPDRPVHPRRSLHHAHCPESRPGGSGTQQNWNDPCATQDFSGFGPAGAVVLNQVSTKDGCDRSTGCGAEVHDAQDVTFTFSDAATGAPVAGIGDVRLEVFDITSVAEFQGSSDWSSPNAPYWAGRYYDAVGFDVTPTSIIPSAYDPGAGTGSLGRPWCCAIPICFMASTSSAFRG